MEVFKITLDLNAVYVAEVEANDPEHAKHLVLASIKAGRLQPFSEDCKATFEALPDDSTTDVDLSRRLESIPQECPQCHGECYIQFQGKRIVCGECDGGGVALD